VVCVLGPEGLFPYNSWLNSLILLTLLSICLERVSSPRWQETDSFVVDLHGFSSWTRGFFASSSMMPPLFPSGCFVAAAVSLSIFPLSCPYSAIDTSQTYL
jgi:hypothetical protein